MKIHKLQNKIMKNSVKVLMVLMIAAVSFSANAQIFGVKGAVGLSNISSPDEADNALFGSALGAKIGGTIELDIAENIYLGSGLGFAKKGASSSNGNFNMFYVEVPVNLRYNFLEVGAAGSLYAISGITVGTLLSANLDGEKLGIGTEADNFFKPIDFGVNFGAGIIFNENLEVGLLSEFGLANVYANNLSNLKNVALLVSVGYKFGM